MNQARRLADDDTNRDGFATMTGAKPARVVNTRRELTELGRRAPGDGDEDYRRHHSTSGIRLGASPLKGRTTTIQRAMLW